MHNPPGVRVVQGRGHLIDDLEGEVVGQRLAGPQHLLEVGALDVLHGDERLLAVAGVVHGDDVGMVELAGGPRLAQERSGARRVAAAAAGGQRLERHQPAEGRVLRQVDDAHGAAAQLLDDLVAAQAFGSLHGSPCSRVSAAPEGGYGAVH